jgi:hypothetical protein
MIGVGMSIKVQNFERVQDKLHRFPKAVDSAIRFTLREYYDEDFRPLLRRVLGGFGAKDVPAQNAPTWAAIKLRAYGISHSLGEITGDLRRDSMAVEPRIFTAANKTELVADFSDVPKAGVPYMPIIHEGLDRLQKEYPMVEATRMMTHRKLLQRLDENLSKAWGKSGG